VTQPNIENPSLNSWVKRIVERDMPVFGKTARDVVSMAEENRPVSVLTGTILQDAGMTARVLRLANSSFYNSGYETLNTVSRAVVVLGYQTIRNICLSVAMMDSLSNETPRKQLLHEMARSFHAAFQAQSIAIERKIPTPEEIFIATLLFRLGEMAFWCYGDKPTTKSLEIALAKPDITENQAEEEVLGFKLSQLTLILARKWQLGELVQDALFGAGGDESLWQPIILAQELATVTRYGWNTPKTKASIRKIASYIGKTTTFTTELLQNNTMEASLMVRMFGTNAIADLIPTLATPEEIKPPQHLTDNVTFDETGEADFLEADPLLQLRILREIVSLPDTTTSLNTVLEMSLEGIYRGTGMDRALFALINEDRSKLIPKYVLGKDRTTLLKNFNIELNEETPNIFFVSIDRHESIWIKQATEREHGGLVTREIRRVLGKEGFFISPVVVKDRPIGLILADRALRKDDLDLESYESFNHFVKQANMTLNYMMREF